MNLTSAPRKPIFRLLIASLAASRASGAGLAVLRADGVPGQRHIG